MWQPLWLAAARGLASTAVRHGQHQPLPPEWSVIGNVSSGAPIAINRQRTLCLPRGIGHVGHVVTSSTNGWSWRTTGCGGSPRGRSCANGSVVDMFNRGVCDQKCSLEGCAGSEGIAAYSEGSMSPPSVVYTNITIMSEAEFV